MRLHKRGGDERGAGDADLDGARPSKRDKTPERRGKPSRVFWKAMSGAIGAGLSSGEVGQPT